MTVDTNPPGALVYMNDQEIGRTPLTRDFIWYGNYDVQIRKDGYDTISHSRWIVAPWWNWLPFDLIATVLPQTFRDHQHLGYTLTPTTTATVDAQELIARGQQLRGQLESSVHTRVPIPTSAPATQGATTRPATTQSHRHVS